MEGATTLFHALGSSSASAPSHSPVQQLGTVYLTLYEAPNPSTLSKDYLNPFYFQSHTLAFHYQLQHVIPLPCINLCNAPGMLRRDISRRFIIIFYTSVGVPEVGDKN